MASTPTTGASARDDVPHVIIQETEAHSIIKSIPGGKIVLGFEPGAVEHAREGIDLVFPYEIGFPKIFKCNYHTIFPPIFVTYYFKT